VVAEVRLLVVSVIEERLGVLLAESRRDLEESNDVDVVGLAVDTLDEAPSEPLEADSDPVLAQERAVAKQAEKDVDALRGGGEAVDDVLPTAAVRRAVDVRRRVPPFLWRQQAIPRMVRNRRHGSLP